MQQQQQQVPRDWHRPVLCCFGDCDGNGWSACFLTYFCACISFGLNRQRAFAANAFLWGGIFVSIWLVAGIIAGVTTDDTECTTERTSHSVTRTCSGTLSAAGGVVLGIAGVLILLLGFWNRVQIREKFGLPGSKCTDFLCWLFCPSCSLCQETRTLWANNVVDGIWQGPAAMTVPMGHPAQQPYPQPYQQPAPYQQTPYQQTPYQQSPYQQPPVQQYDTKM